MNIYRMKLIAIPFILASVSLSEVAQASLAPLPAASAHSYAYAKIFNQAEGNNGYSNIPIYGSDVHSLRSDLPGVSATASSSNGISGSILYTSPPLSSSASGGASASASASFGALHVSASGSASGTNASSSSWSNANAGFTDYLRVDPSASGPVEFVFSWSLDGSVDATPSIFHPGYPGYSPWWEINTSAGITASGGVTDTTTGKTLWAPAASLLTTDRGAVRPFQSSGIVLANPGDILQINFGLGADGSAQAVGGGRGGQESATGSFSADASHTGRFYIKTLTPGAAYVSASGVQYLTAPVPLPAAYSMLFTGLGLIGFVAKRRK